MLPIMATLAMGIAEFGQALKISQILSQSAREGARMSIDADTTTAEVTALVKSTVSAGTGVAPDDVTVTVNPEGVLFWDDFEDDVLGSAWRLNLGTSSRPDCW